MGSIMVSGQGHAAMGFSSAGANEYANAATCGRLKNDPLGTMRAPVLYTASTTSYNPPGNAGGAYGRRWGDYSYTSLDSGDPEHPDVMSIWTVQEYANSKVTGFDRWGTWWGRVGPPVNLTLTLSDRPDPLLAGETITYTLTVRNNEAAKLATGVRVIDTVDRRRVGPAASPFRPGLVVSERRWRCRRLPGWSHRRRAALLLCLSHLDDLVDVRRRNHNHAVDSPRACAGCHAEKMRQAEGSIHFTLLRSGVAGAPGCSDCHSAHAVAPKERYATLTGTPCRGCNEEIFSAYAGSVHGTARASESHLDAPLCSDCHRAHDVKGSASPALVREACIGSHPAAGSTHEAWQPNAALHLQSVSCAACHAHHDRHPAGARYR